MPNLADIIVDLRIAITHGGIVISNRRTYRGLCGGNLIKAGWYQFHSEARFIKHVERCNAWGKYRDNLLITADPMGDSITRN